MTLLENINTTYKSLFTIIISHPAFEEILSYENQLTNNIETITSSSIFKVLSCEPDAATKKLFESHSINFRCTNDMIICYIRTKATEPFVKLPEVSRIRFLVKVQTIFLNTTNVTTVGNEVYHFTNVDRSGTLQNRFLTANASGVDAADLKPMSLVEVEQKSFAVIDILTNVVTPNYRVLDAGLLLSPQFIIKFNTLIT